MNNKGFTLIELLGCFVLVAIVFGVGIYFTSGTLSTALTTVDMVSENEIYSASKTYVLENNTRWKIENDLEYACVSIFDLVESGYFESEEVSEYVSDFAKVFRNNNTKVIDNVKIVKECN